MPEPGLELEVNKAYPNDSGRDICRLDPDTLLHLKLAPGDVVAVEGESTTLARAWRSDRQDWDTDTIRIDGFLRENADVDVGETVTVRPVDVAPAETLVLAPPEGATVSFGDSAGDVVKEQLIKRPVLTGDIVPVMSSVEDTFARSPGQAIPLVAAETTPGGPVRITEGTTVRLREEPVSGTAETERPPSLEGPPAETAAVPDNRCGFTTEELDVGAELGHLSCCRETWTDDRCVWHADDPDKPTARLRESIRVPPPDQDGVRLDGVVLRDTDLRNVDLPRCSLVHADLAGADLAGADLSGAIVQHATLDDANLSRALLGGADLTGTTGRNIHARGTDFTHATLAEAALPDGDFTDVRFDDAYLRAADLSGSTFEDASFENATLEAIRLVDARLDGVELSGEYLDQANLTGASLPRADLSACGLEGAKLDDANLRRAVLDGATLRNASLADADLRYANCTDAILADAALVGADIAAATLEDVNAKNAHFNHATLERAVFTQADVFDADLSHAELYGAVFTDTRINDGTVFGETCVYDPRHADGNRGDVNRAEWTYRLLEKLSRENALPEQAREAYVDRKEVRRRSHYENVWDHRQNGGLSRLLAGGRGDLVAYLKATWNHHAMNHGDDPWQVVTFSLAVIALCTLAYPLWGVRTVNDTTLTYAHNLSQPVSLLGKSAYFSTVTFTTLGYGDVQPVGWGQTLAMFESFLGALLMALLVFVLGRRATW